MRRQLELIVCALIALTAIGGAVPADALAGGQKKAARARAAQAKSQSQRPCVHCQMAQLRQPKPAAETDPAAAAQVVEETPREPTARAAEHTRERPRRRRGKPSLRLRTKIAALHLAEALHLYHPQPDAGIGRPRLTEERVWWEVAGSLMGVDVGLTLSEITRVKGKRGDLELIHVVSADGLGQNYESILKRIQIGHGQRFEIQGPAINTAAGMPLGFRAVGLGLTSDLFEPGQNRALSYTAEIKLTERSVLYWAPFWAPGAAKAIDGLLGTAGQSTVANLVGGALPVVSAALAVQSAVRAWKTFRDPKATRLQKALAAGHVVADSVRVAFPLVGTLANVALVGVTAGISYLKVKRARAEAEHPVHPRFLRGCARGGCTD
ncbi:MAG TPA: hypothetical protein VFU21_23460 [Kofleriaceae bacterium]|nr:hypothetical protein [Kofleriaceae bacterium]